MSNEKMYNDLAGFLKMAVSNGAKTAYISNDKSFLYGFVIMPDDVVLEITKGNFDSWQVCYPYIPCKHAGSGCQVLSDLALVSWDNLLLSEKEGLILAHKYNARPYLNSDEWKKYCWSYTANQLDIIM